MQGEIMGYLCWALEPPAGSPGICGTINNDVDAPQIDNPTQEDERKTELSSRPPPCSGRSLEGTT